jgi:MFS family permease
MKAGWALLRRRDFGLLWAGGLISETGDWFLLVGLPIWVLQLTGSSLVTATVFLVGLLPGLVVGPLAGVLVDRWDRRRTLVAVSLAQAAFLLPLLAVHGRDDLWIVYVVMAVEASLAQLNDPARNALVPSLVGADDLVGANALIGLNSNLARLAGSPLGGILVELAGLPGLVIGDAASFLLGAALIGLVGSPRRTVAPPDPSLPGPPPPVGASHPNPLLPGTLAEAGAGHPPLPGAGAPAREGSPPPGSVVPVVHSPASTPASASASLSTSTSTSVPVPAPTSTPAPGRGVLGEWVDGLRVTLGSRELRWGLVVNGLAAVAQGVFTVLFVVFVSRELGGDGADVGLLRGVQAIGGLLGGVLVVAMARRLPAGRLLGVSLLVFALIDLAIWNGPMLTTAIWLYLGLFVAAGIPGIGVLTGLTSLVQERTDEAYLGRVFATYLGSFNGLMAVGMLLAGLLGDTVGVVTVLNGQAALYLLAGVVAVATLGPRSERYPRTSKRARMPLA